MKLPTLLVSDLHLAAGESAAYRFDLFPWLNEVIVEEKVKTLMILGDLTDQKDNHGAELVNRVVQCIRSLKVPEIKILCGNHDWLRQGHEFFKFLNALPGVEFITSPKEDEDSSGEAAFYLPYSKNPAKDWQGLDLSHYDFVFLHQTITGSISSTGQELEGDTMPDLSALPAKIYAGDIHVPQKIGNIEYVGSPFHVHFGDAFKPRAVLIQRNRKPVDLHFQTISRVSVTATPDHLPLLAQRRFKEGDQVKLRIQLAESEKHEWSRIKREAQKMLVEQGVQVHGIELVLQKNGRRLVDRQALGISYSPAESVMRFVEREDLTASAYEAAEEIMSS